MNNFYESLEKIGLTRNEVTVYKYLLRKGLSTGAQIWMENSLDKSSAYRAIGQLQEKRLIYAIGETRNQKFAANPVEALEELHSKVESDLQSVKKDISDFIKDINEYAKENYKSSRIQVYEGDEGFKLFTKQRIEGHVDLVRQFGPGIVSVKDYNEVLESLIKDRVKRNIPIKILFDLKTRRPEYRDRSRPEILKEVRQIQKDLSITSTIVTHGSSTSLYTIEDGKFMGVVINDRLITTLFNSMFDFMWEYGKKID